MVADRLQDPAKAYDVIELARGRAAADVLRALPLENPPATQAAVDQARTISRLQIRLMRARSTTERKQLLDELWEAEQRTKVHNPDSRIKTARDTDRLPLKTFQRSLSATEIVLEYVLTEPNSYCLVIARERARLVRLPSRKQIDASVDRFVAEIRKPNGNSDAAARDLFTTLLPPLAEWQAAKRVFIVPDGKLHLLPFDTVLSLNDVQSRILSTVPSANVLFLLRTRSRTLGYDRPLLAVGGVPYDRMFAGRSPASDPTRSSDTRGVYDASYPSNLPLLPSAQAEVLDAARLLGRRSVALTGDDATESGVKAQDLRSFGMLHFAAHAFAEPKFPQRAAIVLLNDTAAGDDGLLQAREIGQLRLNAGAVVLSACDTSVGPTLGQEGIFNIARAFLHAGARSVITTLCSVSDATSTAVMRRFYENLAAGEDVASALARSKATVLEQFGADARATTAAFQLVGVGDHRVAAMPQKTAGGSLAR